MHQKDFGLLRRLNNENTRDNNSTINNILRYFIKTPSLTKIHAWFKDSFYSIILLSGYY